MEQDLTISVSLDSEIVAILSLLKRDPRGLFTSGIAASIGTEIMLRSRQKPQTPGEREILIRLQRCSSILSRESKKNLEQISAQNPDSPFTIHKKNFMEFLDVTEHRQQSILQEATDEA